MPHVSRWGMALGALLACAGHAAAEDAALLAAGQAVYDDKCAACHGPGLRNPGSSFDLRELHPEERPRFDTSVLQGKGQMPAWTGTLSHDDLDALWAYVRENAYD